MSENYRALTRKYRPLNFEDIVSQEHVSGTIQNAIKQNRLSHAYMFCGPRGVGKTTMARVLARSINNVGSDVDGEMLAQTLNIIEIDAASNNSVDDVRDLRERVRIPPQNGRYKVYIIDEVHMLSKAAFNALLKTLEEPPAHAIFIFATTEPHKVLPTILSRVQRFDFKRISVEEIVARLRKISLDEGISIDDESLHVIAKKADGALRDALGLMDQAIAFCGDTITHNELLKALNVVGTDRLFEFMECVKAHDADKGLNLINELLQDGHDIQEFLIGLAEHLRNLYVAHHNKQLYLVEASPETKIRYAQSAPDFSRDDLIRMLHIVSEAQIKIKDANQPRVQFEITLLKLIHMERSQQLSKLLAELEALKKKPNNLLNGSSGTYQDSKKSATVAVNEGSEAKPDYTGHQPEGSVNGRKDTSHEPSKNPNESQEVHQPAASRQDNHGPDNESEDDDAFDIGRPALALHANTSERVVINRQEKTATSIEATAETEVVVKEKLSFGNIQECWPGFLATVRAQYPMILHLQLERIQLKDLKGNELVLQCDSEFARKMIHEQSRDLARKLKEHVGHMLRFKIVVGNASQPKSHEISPYEKFKQLQQKNPILRDIVEIFGAELEY